jgi:hypothetical protein
MKPINDGPSQTYMGLLLVATGYLPVVVDCVFFFSKIVLDIETAEHLREFEWANEGAMRVVFFFDMTGRPQNTSQWEAGSSRS